MPSKTGPIFSLFLVLGKLWPRTCLIWHFSRVLLKNGMKTYKPRLLVKSKKYENQRPLDRLAYLQTWHHPDKEKESKMNPWFIRHVQYGSKHIMNSNMNVWYASFDQLQSKYLPTDVFYLIIKWDRIHKLWDYNPYPKWNVMIVVWMITSSILRKYYLPMGEVIKNPVTQTKGKGVICLPKGTPGNRYSWLSV